jgi:hypothetical protein
MNVGEYVGWLPIILLKQANRLQGNRYGNIYSFGLAYAWAKNHNAPWFKVSAGRVDTPI